MKRKKWVSALLAWLISIILVTAANSLGILWRLGNGKSYIGFTVSLALLILLAAGSAAGEKIMRRCMDRMHTRQIHSFLDARMARMGENPRREARRMAMVCLLALSYVLLFVLSVLAVGFFCGVADMNTTVPVVCVFILYGFVRRFFRDVQKTDISRALPEEAYPRLYALAKECADLDSREKLYIFPDMTAPEGECNASVGRQGKSIYLVLGPMLLCSLSEEELRQVLLHEFAHIRREHSKEYVRFSRLAEYMDDGEDPAVFSIWSSLVMRLPLAVLLLEGQCYFRFSSIGKEKEADGMAADSGDVRHQACALAKLNAHRIFLFEEERYLNFYRSETPQEDIMTGRVRLFREKLVSRETQWRQILENAIPSKSATHPTFRQRWDALGNCEYSLEPASMDDPLSTECWAVAAAVDQEMQSIEPERYAQLRKVHYLDHAAAVTDYEAGKITPEPENLRDVIYGYYCLGLPQQAEALCDRVIQENDSLFASAFARFWKGILMLYRYEKEGIAYIYQAMETNRNYIEDGLQKIGDFCTLMGLEAELEALRAKAADLQQEIRDTEGGGIDSRAKLSQETLPQDWQARILDYILKHAEGKIQQVYLVHEKLSTEFARSAFVLRYVQDASQEDMARIYDCVFCLLDDWPVDWEFSLYDYEPSMEKPLQKVSGSCIYDAGIN